MTRAQNVINRTLILIVILVSNISLSQNEDRKKSLSFQEECMKTAEERVRKRQLDKAYFSYQFAVQEDSTSNNGKIALRKSDSLKTILRKELRENIQGTWRWKATGSNWGIGSTDKSGKIRKVLVISNSAILFYEIDKKTKKSKLIKREQIQFNDIPDLWPTYSEFIFSDKQIWRISVSGDKKNLTITNTGEVVNKKTRSQIVCGNTDMFYERVR